MTLVKTGNHVGDTDSLPRWARNYIARLERQGEEARQELAEHVQRGNFVKGDYLSCRVPRVLHLHTSESPVAYGALRVTFNSDDEVEVSTTGRLLIETQAGNVVTLRSKP